MAPSCSLSPLPSLLPDSRRVRVTGAAGKIGSSYALHAPRHHQKDRMGRTLNDPRALESFGEGVVTSLNIESGLEDS